MTTIEWFEGSRAALAGLFALADDSPAAVAAYRDVGRVLVAREGSAIAGHVQLVAGDRAAEAEVKSLAVREDRQGAGIGRLLVERAAAVCREEGRSTLLVSTAAADTRVLRFYQVSPAARRARRVHPESGYPEIDIDGIPLRDRSGSR
jgi:GNAT superfamily N-acetyltransferase